MCHDQSGQEAAAKQGKKNDPVPAISDFEGL